MSNIIKRYIQVFEKLILKKFSELEAAQLLDPGNDLDIKVLHHVVGPLLKDTVDNFKNGWNEHPVSTAEHFTPRQLYTLGLLRLKSSGSHLSELIQVTVYFFADSLRSILFHGLSGS